MMLSWLGGKHGWNQSKCRDANLWRPKIGRLSFFHHPPAPQNFNNPPARKIDLAPNGNDLDIIWCLTWCTYYQNSNHRFDARNNLCQWLNKCKNAPETVLRIKKIHVFSYKWAKSQTKSVLLFTKYSIFIVDVNSGRFMYQSGRAGDEAKSGRVGITVYGILAHLELL